mmetsp:Transcript_24728/g.72392  ORF Transcript_24728/g.72392 Transcript_24728/m.72392 type:complete len:222 (-) Transcript_24728:1568-2233(-)
MLVLPPRGEVSRQRSHIAGGMVRIQKRKLCRENDESKEGLPEEGEVTLPRFAEIVVGGPRSIERVDDEIGREAGEELYSRGAEDALPVELLEAVLDLGGGLGRGECLREDVGILDGLTSALSEVGHHGMDGVAHENDVAFGPGAEELGGAVVEIALLDGIGGRGVEDGHDLVGPSLVEALDVFDEVLLVIGLTFARGSSPSGGGALGARGKGEEGVPLDPV